MRTLYRFPVSGKVYMARRCATVNGSDVHRGFELIEPDACACPECGGPLGALGTDTAEVLEVKTISFTVTRHIRPKKRCSKCAVIVQAPAPARPIEKSFAGASLLAWTTSVLMI